MNPTTAKIVYTALKKLYDADRANVYTLQQDCVFYIRALVPEYDGLYFKFRRVTRFVNEVVTEVTLKAYGLQDSGEAVCDGATLAPDWVPGAKPGSAVHDPGYLELDAIAAAWKDDLFEPGALFKRDWVARKESGNSRYWTRGDVRFMMDTIYGNAMAAASPFPFITRTYYSAVRYLGGLFLTSKKWLPKAVPLFILPMLAVGCTSCLKPADLSEWPYGLPLPEKQPGKEQVVTSADAVPYDQLIWKYGGFNGRNAKHDQVTLADMSFNGTRISYRWAVGLDAWGIPHTQHNQTICAAFFLRDGKWEGGKFDWVSTSRPFRDIHHVEYYNNWAQAGLRLPVRYPCAFVVVHTDGQRRSNVIAEGL